MTETQALLADFVENRSEAAFREIVARYLNLVYSTALRLVGGDAHRAQDVAQSVFLHLAQKAHALKSDSALGGWLHRDTCHIAATLMRGERRRQQRELQAAAMNFTPDHSEANLAQLTPVLDEAINQLGATDRAAIVLRFYEQRDLQAVGRALGSTENAAQKRIARALESLRVLLQKRGVALSAAALASMLTTEAVSAAPVAMIPTVAASALTGLAKGTGSTLTILKLMAAAKLKTAVVGAILIAAALTPIMLQHRADAALREQEESMRTQAEAIERLSEENRRLVALLDQSKASRSTADPELREVLKLRGEIGTLQRDLAETKRAVAASTDPSPLSPEEQLAQLKSKYAGQVTRLKDWLEAHPAEKIPELAQVPHHDWIDAVETLEKDSNFDRSMSSLRRRAEVRVLQDLGSALRDFARANNGQPPTELSQLKPFLKSPIDDSILQRYQIVPSSNLVNELREAGETVITEAAPVNAALDSRMAYGLSQDGRVQQRYADELVTNRWNLIQ